MTRSEADPPYFSITPDSAQAELGPPVGTAGFAEVARKAAQGRADLVGRGLNPEGRQKLNLDSGMIGIPELNEEGVKVTFLLDNLTTLGSALEITSELYPAANGNYTIYKLGFNIASRDTPFYYVAEAKRI